MSLRKTLFWIHLVTGLLAGLVIAILSLTGAALAFEKDLVVWAERDLRQVVAPAAPAPRLSVDELRQRLAHQHPDLKQVGVTLSADPSTAVVFTAGRDGLFFADPYTGAIRKPETRRMHALMDTLTDWHRWLALKEGARSTGRLITGVANLVFLGLCITGIALWWPRNWTRRGLKALLVVNLSLKGRARDWNWHNALGIWSLPVLVVITATALPISFRWGSNLVYRLAGEQPPGQQGPGSIPVPPPGPGLRPASLDRVLAKVQEAVPGWREISLRNGGGRKGSGPGAVESRGPQPLTATVRPEVAWPRTATVTLTLDPYTVELLSHTGWKDLSPGRRLRTWTRFLHTGEALGWWGQALAGIASLGSLVLVYTGFALSWRRFVGKRPNPGR